MINQDTKQVLANEFEFAEFSFDRAGLEGEVAIGEDVRTGHAWMGFRDTHGEEVVRVERQHGWNESANRWQVTESEDKHVLTDKHDKLSFRDAVARAIEEYKRLL